MTEHCLHLTDTERNPGCAAQVEKAVRDAESFPEAQRRQRLVLLRLRWHPDKNSAVLPELAEVVTKAINAAIEASEARILAGAEASPGSRAALALSSSCSVLKTPEWPMRA